MRNPRAAPRIHPGLRAIVPIIALMAAARPARADSEWVLVKSTLAYHVSHPLHETEGVSHEARGKAVCHGGECEVLVAVPVKSFDSGDSNRDLHMLQVTRGAQFPLVSVRCRVPESASASPTIEVDLEIQFAGQTVTYRKVPFQQASQGDEIRITGTIPAALSDFKIDPPTLFTFPTKNEIPIRVDLAVRRDSGR
jgi:hypothetical protein